MPRGKTAVAIVLDGEQKEQLEAFANSRSLPHGLASRARIILLAAEGMQNLEIVEKVGLNRNDVGKFRIALHLRVIDTKSGMVTWSGYFEEPRKNSLCYKKPKRF